MSINKRIDKVVHNNWRRYYKPWLFRILIIILINIFVLNATCADMLESWQSCCGATCLRTVSGLLGNHTNLAEVRKMLHPNNRGETSLAEIAATAQKMGFHAMGFSIKADKLQECSVPLIAHKPPQHFVVVLGLGKNKGVMFIDPPYRPRKIAIEELMKQEYWNAVAVSGHPIDIKNLRAGAIQSSPTVKETVSNEYGGLYFNNTFWNFGSLKPNFERAFEFTFTNINKNTVNLSKVKANCACLKVVNYTEKIEPSEKGTIKVLLDTSGLQGYITKKIIGIINNDNTGNNEQLILTVFGEVSRRGELILKPYEIHFTDLINGSKLSKSLTLRRVGFEKLSLKEIKPSSSNISVQVIDGFEHDSYEANIVVNIEAQGKMGPFNHEVLIKTDNKEYPTIRLPISGRIVPHIIAEPADVFFGLIFKEDNFQEKTVVLRSKKDKSFNIEDVELSTVGIDIDYHPINESRSAWQVKLTTTPSIHKGIFKGNMLLKTDDPDVPKIEIPYTGLVSG